jgi:molybdopterin converting factor subunit 1
MRVTVRLFARLRELAGSGELTRDVDAPATVAVVWLGLVRDYPEFASYERAISCAVNDDYAKLTTPLADGDDVAFLPPVSGG